ncbi:GNAT family N-acetyltransferase [Listeria weihenstephanensis]|uniref:GNAT family N-acetyltransferase n=1 Tax=Listeria weihenstephanensis TaxID=1006155 RepID=A0A841Z8W0_9LIST|nr:GNAT family protein [Listeria weihenstephanensis]MBC1501289.1 GNAT family N-acetyltransferase [Listeria weihenstephanensis]
MTLTLQSYTKEAQQAIQNYTLTDDTFCAHPLELLAKAAEKASYHCILMYDQDQLVGFFVLDNGEDVKIYTEAPDTLLLRGYSIDSTKQGKGYGTRSLSQLSDYVKHHFPTIKTVVLAVNKRNIPAQKLYLKSGFIQTNRTIMGPRGEQFVYELAMK